MVRWHAPRLALSDAADRHDLEQMLRLQTAQLAEETGGAASLITWTIACQGPLLAALRRGQLAAELTALLRSEFGHRSTPAWTVGIAPELPEQLPAAWYKEESLRGDFLRGVQSVADPASTVAVAAADAAVATSTDPLSLPLALVEPGDLPPAAAEKIGWPAVSLEAAEVRRRVLREVAWLGADLLCPNEVGPPEAQR